jgi:hypothetical protein
MPNHNDIRNGLLGRHVMKTLDQSSRALRKSAILVQAGNQKAVKSLLDLESSRRQTHSDTANIHT